MLQTGEAASAGEIPSYQLDKRYIRPEPDSPTGSRSRSRSSATAVVSRCTWSISRRGHPKRRLAERSCAGRQNGTPLTGLLNRRSLIEALKRGSKQRAAGGEASALILVDLDYFKSINDGFGHPAGDRVLIAIGPALAARRWVETTSSPGSVATSSLWSPARDRNGGR